MAVAGSSLSGAQRQDARADQKAASLLDESVLVLPAAHNVKREKVYSGLIRYQIRETFPAQPVLKWLDTQLATAGWEQSSEDILNPGEETALRDWGITEVSGERSFTWLAYWKDRAGNVLRMSVLYPARLVGNETVPSDRGNVEVIAFSQRVAEKLRNAKRPRPDY